MTDTTSTRPQVHLTYKYRLKDASATKCLARQAKAVNQVWNWCTATQREMQRRRDGGARTRPWFSAFDLEKMAAGTSVELGIHSGTIGKICRVFASSRDKRKDAPKFRPSFGQRRALGWVPFKATDRRIDGNSVIYLGKRLRWFGSKRRPLPATAKGGAFVEDSLGRWWVTFEVEVSQSDPRARAVHIGIDLGLKALATCSDGAIVEALQHFRQWEARLAVAQKAGNKRRVREIHSRIANARRDHLHKASTKIVEANDFIAIGNVSPSRLKKTRMAKSVSDASWYGFKRMLHYKSQKAGASFVEVDERFTSQTCSACGVIPAASPKGMGALGMRSWTCSDCGTHHDRDVNAAQNILRIGLSVQPRGDESHA